MAAKGFMISKLIGELPIQTIKFIDELSYLTDVCLTGSRYFGNYTDKSDWDFFIRRFRNYEEFLTDFGFKRVKMTEYKDYLISDVYQIDNEKGNIDIQIIDKHSFDYKVMAQNFIYFHHDMLKEILSTSKENRSLIWNVVITLVQTDKDALKGDLPITTDYEPAENEEYKSIELNNKTNNNEKVYYIETRSLNENFKHYKIIVDKDMYDKYKNEAFYVNPDVNNPNKLIVKMLIGKGRYKLFNRIIMGLKGGEFCVPRNGDWLDLRKENLQVLNRS